MNARAMLEGSGLIRILFKMLVLQQLFNLSDEALEFQVNDRRSFEEFVGLGVMNTIPDATTIAFFRERLRKAGVIDELFERFEEHLRTQGLEARGGQTIDATLLPVPKQRNSRPENESIKRGQLPDGWANKPERLRQRDLDARWVKKNGISHYGYKNVSALTPLTASSADTPLPQPIFSTAR